MKFPVLLVRETPPTGENDTTTLRAAPHPLLLFFFLRRRNEYEASDGVSIIVGRRSNSGVIYPFRIAKKYEKRFDDKRRGVFFSK